ncbi:MAG: DUF4097 family beta strand repeat-containing protein [Bdellovibrionales bacterium]
MLRIMLTIFLIPIFSFAEVVTKEFQGSDLKELKVFNLSGDIVVSASKGNQAKVIANKTTFEPNCNLIIDKRGALLMVEVSRNGIFESDICNVHFNIEIPEKISLNIKSGSGDLEIFGTKGNVALKSGNGDTKISAEVIDLQANLGSGSIEVDGIVGSADLETGSGDISLNYAIAPQSGEVEIKAGSGNAVLIFPKDTKLSTKYSSGSGDLVNDLGDSTDAQFKVSMKAGSGNLKISQKN